MPVDLSPDLPDPQAVERIAALKDRLLDLALDDAPLDAVLDRLLRTVEALSRDGVRGSILLQNAGRLYHCAAPSLPQRYIESIDGVAVEADGGSCGRAAFLRTSVVAADIRRSPHWAKYRRLAEPHGLRACWSTPIIARAGEVLGTFAMYYDVPRIATKTDLELIELVGRTAAVLIERRRMEAALVESEARFRNIADQAPLMTWVTDALGRCVYVNRLWTAFTGQTAAAAAGLGWLAVVHAADKDEVERRFGNAVRTQSSFRMEYRVGRADGSFRWVVDTAAPRHGTGGEFLGHVGSVVDIDEQREVQARLCASEERLRLAAGAANLGTWEWDPGRKTFHIDEPAARLCGLGGSSTLTHRSLLKAVHPGDWGLLHQAIRSAGRAADGSDLAAQFRVRSPTNVQTWISAQGRVLTRPSEGGAPGRHVVGVIEDVTAQKSAETVVRLGMAQALAERKLFADIVERTDAFVQVLDPSFRWLALNRAAAEEFERVYGVRPRVGASMIDALGRLPDQQAAVRAIWGRALNGEEFTEVGVFGDPMLDRRHYQMKYNALRDANGRCVGAFQFVIDVTERVHERERLSATEAALQQAQKMESLGQLTGSIAHDFNNLLTPIMGALERLSAREVPEPRARRLAEGALASAERARQLSMRLLAFSRRQPLDVEPTDVGLVCDRAMELLSRSLPPSVELTLDSLTGLPPVRVATDLLEMALLNLVINARDAMAAGGRIHIEVRPDVDPPSLPIGRYIRIAVIDSGSGMDEATRLRAAEPFFTTKPLGAGTGLGLASVNKLAIDAGGRLELASTVGGGTTVTVWLLCCTDDAQQTSQMTR